MTIPLIFQIGLSSDLSVAVIAQSKSGAARTIGQGLVIKIINSYSLSCDDLYEKSCSHPISVINDNNSIWSFYLSVLLRIIP